MAWLLSTRVSAIGWPETRVGSQATGVKIRKWHTMLHAIHGGVGPQRRPAAQAPGQGTQPERYSLL